MSIVDDFKKRRDSGFVNDASSSLGKGDETYAERKSRLKKAKVNFGVDDEYLKSYENDYNSYRDKVSSTGETNQEDWYDLNQKQRYLKAYLNSNSKNMEYEDYNNFNNFLNDTDTSSRNLYRLAKQATAEKTKKKRIDFGQEKETLNTDTANRLEEMARQMRMAGADEATIDKAVYGKDGWESANKPRTYEAQYGDFTHTDDYYNNKDYRTSKTGEGKRDLLSGYYFDTGYKDIEHDIINGDANARLIYDANYGDNPSMENTYLDRLDAEEKAKYNYLYNTKGKEEAMKYIDTIKKDLMSRQGAKEAEYWQNEADKDYGNDIANGANGVALSALNVLLGMAKPLEAVGQGLDYLQSKITGEGGINEYKPQNFRATNISNAITSTIGEKWDNAVQNGMKQAYINDIRANGGSEADVQYALDNYDENTGKGVGNFAYQTAMSMANFLSTALVTGNFASGLSDIEKKIAENLSLAIMGAGATADTVIEAKQRGADDDQAFVMGAIAGIAEIVTEKFSLETLLDTSLYKSSEIKYILKNTLAEGSEEVASDLINTVADIIIMSDKSELQARIQELVSEGKSESEAFGIAIAEFGKDLGLSFLGGALSGGILSVGGAYAQGRNVNNLIQTYGDDLTSNEITNTVLGEGLSSAEGSDARTNALALERMIGDGKTLSNEDVARQMMLNLQQNSSDISLTDEEVRELENAVREELTGIKNEEENKIASNPLIDANTEQAKVEEFANNFEYKPAQAVISSMYGGNMSAVEYNKLANDAYMAGYKGEAIDTVDTNNKLTNAQKSAIYEVGQMSRKQDNRYESELQLSEGEQWNDSKNTRVITNELEVNPSEDKRWNYSKKRSAKDGESASLIRGKTVKVKDLIGIESKGEVTLIEEGYDTKYTAKARQIAKDNGLKLQLVSGLISVTESDGTESLNRGLIKGDTMYVQVDHANFTADQLVAHEVTHPKIDNGEIDTKATMKKAKKVLGKKKFNQAVRAYAQAYMGMNAEVDEKAFNYYFNEIICDAVAGMNAFEQIDNRVLISSHAPVVDAVAKSVVYDANKANAPPSNNEVKMSQEMASNGVVLSEEQSDFFANSKIRDVVGRLLVMYHGTARADRVGNVFRSDRATSGPMAFFTSDPQIAENYSKYKNDTSLYYDEDYDMYETRFKVKTDRFDRPLYKLWSEIPFSKKQDIKKKAGELREDWDSGDGSFVLVEGNTSANGGFEWQLKESNGNVIKALIEQWLNSGTLFNEEERFLEVLEKTGITQAIKDKYGVEPYYKDKNFRDEKVYSVFLNIVNPFVAYEQVNEKFVDEFEKWANEHYDEYEEKDAYSDMWDKNNVSAEDFADRMRSDIENNTTHAWTSIPDIVTDYLKTLGYDGIVDNGGKFHNAEHQVVIPFYSNQIKNTDNLNPTSSDDIRYSRQMLSDGTEYIKLDGNLFLDENGNELTPRQAYKRLVGEYLTLDDGEELVFIDYIKGLDVFGKLFKYRPRYSPSTIDIKKLNTELNKNITDILKHSNKTKDSADVRTLKHLSEGIVSFDTREINVADDDGAYKLIMSIAKAKDGTKFAYSKDFLTEDKELWEKIKKEESQSGDIPLAETSDDKLSQDEESVNNKISKSQEFALSEDEIDNWLSALSIDDILEALDISLDEADKPKEKKPRREDKTYKVLKQIGMTLKGVDTLGWTNERLDGYLKLTASSSNKDYAQAYVANISPLDFLKLTAGTNGHTIEGIQNSGEKYGDLDLNKIDEDFSYPMMLILDTEGKVTPRIVGHEGRHRMMMLGQAGFNQVPVVIYNYDNKYNKQIETNYKVNPQLFGYDEYINKNRAVTFSEMIPLNYNNRELIQTTFGEGSNATVKFSQEITNADLKALQKENRELEKRLEKTAEQVARWKSELKVDHTLRVQKSDINRITDKLLQEYSAGTDKKSLKQKLTDLANYVLNNNSDENYVDTVKNMAIDIASDIINDAKVLDEGGYSDVYNDLKMMLTTGNGMKLSSRDIADIPDFKDFKKQDFGKLKITESGRDVDSTYEELMEMYPELFSENVTHPADRLMEMVDVVNKIAPRMENPFDMYLIDMAEITETLANEIVDMAINGEMKATLPNFATRQENKLNEQKAKTEKAKEQVKEMRDKKNAEIEEVKSQARQKMEKLRQKRNEDIRNLKEDFADKQYRDREKRNAQELRKKIEKKVKDLNQKLLNPTDKKHIPQDFRGVVAKLLESINMTSPKDNDPDTIRLASLRTEAFRDLQKAYEKVMKEGEYVIDDDMLGTDGILEQIIEWGNEPIMEMSAYKLGIIYNTIRSLEHSISTYNRLLSEENGRTIHMYSEGLMNDNESVKAKTEWNGRLGGVVNRMSLGMLTPQAFFHKLGKYGDMLFKKMRQAQDKYISILKTASDFTNNNIKGIDVNKLSEQTREVVLGGRNVELSAAQLMELYVLANREQGLKHILTGGIVPDAVKNKGVKANRTLYAIKGITQDELTRAFTKLTPEQITIADKLQEFLSKDMSRFGNEATMKVYGYEKFNEEKYWHINVYELHMKDKGDNGQVKPTTVAGKGMAKNTIPNANVAIRVGDIFNSFAKHVVDMAEYSAWLAPMADINRIRNYKTKDGDNIRSVKETINKVHGEGGYKYLAKLLTDLSNGVASEQEYFGGLLGNMKASAVGTNLRVILQQPTAIYRALSLIDAKYLLPKANPVSAFKGWEKAIKYSPIAQWKDWGYFDINTGRAIKDVLFNNTSKMAKAKEIAMKPAGMADSYAWGMLWNAVESETKATTDLKVGSEEYYNHCAERFSDIIDQTQVVDGVLQRSEMMRSTNGMDKMATAFMGEPTKQYNQFLNAVNDVRRGNKDAKNKMFKTVVAMASAGVLNACVQSIVDAMRHSDRDKNYWEQWLEEMIGITGDEEKFEDYMKNIWSSNLFNVVDVAGYIPYVKDFESILQGYTVERMDMSAVSDAVKSANNFMKVLKGESKLSFANALTDFAFQIGNVFGVSAYNLKRDILGLTSTVINSSGNLEASYELQKTLYNITNTNTRSIFIGYLYEAYKTDKNLYNKILKELQKTYTNDQIQTSMRNLQKKEAGVTKLADLKEAPYTLK